MVDELGHFQKEPFYCEARADVIATMKGNRKKHGYEVLTADKQVIARCYAIGENSYSVDILRSDFDYFLILNYIVVLDLAKVWMSILSPNS